jgi:hypothetical protein
VTGCCWTGLTPATDVAGMLATVPFDPTGIELEAVADTLNVSKRFFFIETYMCCYLESR